MSTSLFGRVARYEGGLHEVAAGTYAWLQPNGELGESNAGLVVGDGSSLLIDTLWDLPLTRALLAAAQAVTDAAGAPIRTLVNTHADGDHCWGNQLLDPAVDIAATAAAAEEMAEVKPAVLQALTKAAAGAGLAGRAPLPFPGRAELRGAAAFAEQLAPYDFSGIDVRLPTRTFSGTLTLDVGGREVQLIEVGPAHTLGDLIAWVPDVRVLFINDLLFSGVAPIMWAGPLENWLAALDTAAALDPAVVVPGHGPVGTASALGDLRAYWTWLRDAAPSVAGAPLADAARTLLASPEFQPFATLDDPARIAVNLFVLREGGTVRMGTGERLKLLGTMAELRAELAA